MSKRTRLAFKIALLTYIVILLYLTVFNRFPGFYKPRLQLFWSYRIWLSGNLQIGKEILGNVAVFIPIGLLMSAINADRRTSFIWVFVTGLGISFLIEILQFLLMRGTPEIDDIFNNCFGSVIGWILYLIINNILKNNNVIEVLTFGGVIIISVGLVFCSYRDNEDSHISSQYYSFQIDSVLIQESTVMLRGFAIWNPDYYSDIPEIILRSTDTKKTIRLELEYGIEREDVNAYFNDEIDYSKTGFLARGNGFANDEEYEVLFGLNAFTVISTEIYITNTDIHFCSYKKYKPPELVGTDLDFILEGYLRVYRPDKHCVVYQFDNSLYWITDREFQFESDGSTYIQYQLWSSQPNKLPQQRIENGLYWDNIGGNFEDYEITHDLNCGKYRVMKRDLPTEYPITSIVTGYYKNGKWFWQNYFRPIYEFH